MTERRIETAKRNAVGYRNYRRARDRALARLATAYPEHYKELLEQEKANDETQGRKWLDINGTTSTSELGVRPSPAANASSEADHSGTYQGDNGGEA
jgi:hypothetical protein